MVQPDTPGEHSLARYREYLLLLARAQLGPGLGGKLDPSAVVEETLRRARQDIGQLGTRTEPEVAAWLRALLTDVLTNAVRALGRQGGEAEVPPDQALEYSSARLEEWLADARLPPEQAAARNEQLLGLAGALTRLPTEQRHVLELKHLHGCTLAEIGERTGYAKAAVVGLLFEGMKALRSLLHDPGGGAGG
jgi:RNA polymerase sigma-70 factor (ECF subfamily)